MNIFYSQNIDEAIDFIKQHEPPEGYFVGFSGGKDSIVTLDLVKRAGVKHEAFYSMTLIDPPEVVTFLKEHYADVTRLKPKMTFWQGCMKWHFPHRTRRWCCDVLKKEPAKSIPLKHRIMGIRAEESARRAARGRIEKMTKHAAKGMTSYHPIYLWSSADIWDYIRERDLKYPKLYDEGFARLGCTVCPFMTKKQMIRNRAAWPNMYRILDIYLNKKWDMAKEDLLSRGFTYDEFMQWPQWRTKAEREQGKAREDQNAMSEV